MLTRRRFLKLCATIPLLRWRWFRRPVMPVAPVAPPETPAQPEAQMWGFPLAFPAWFPTEAQVEEMRRPHKVYLPLIQNG